MKEPIQSRIRACLGACLLAFPSIAPAQTNSAGASSCLEILTPSVNFYQVWVGQEGRGYVQIRNACQRDLTIKKIAVSRPVFRAVTPLPLTLTALNSAWLEFRLRPDSAGPVSGTACLISNAGSQPACASLSGTGVIPPIMSVSPGSLQPAQAAGTQGAVSLQITNSGGDRLEAIVDFTGQTPRPAEGWKVAFVQTPTPAGYGRFIDMVRSLANVDTLAVFDGSAAVPTLSYLNGFDIVLVEAGGENWVDAGATGDTLAAYLQSGGRIAYFAQALADQPTRLYGLIQYFTTITGRVLAFPGQSGTLADHPVNAGVSSFWAASAMTLDRIPDNSAVSLGNYADYGYITGAVSVQYPLMLLNFHPADQNWSGDVPRLIANTLDYLGTQAAWMTTNGVYPFPGTDIFTVSAGATRTLEMKVWTYRMAPGTYQGEIRLLHSDPAQASPYVVPVTLTVTP